MITNYYSPIDFFIDIKRHVQHHGNHLNVNNIFSINCTKTNRTFILPKERLTIKGSGALIWNNYLMELWNKVYSMERGIHDDYLVHKNFCDMIFKDSKFEKLVKLKSFW